MDAVLHAGDCRQALAVYMSRCCHVEHLQSSGVASQVLPSRFHGYGACVGAESQVTGPCPVFGAEVYMGSGLHSGTLRGTRFPRGGDVGMVSPMAICVSSVRPGNPADTRRPAGALLPKARRLRPLGLAPSCTRSALIGSLLNYRQGSETIVRITQAC